MKQQRQSGLLDPRVVGGENMGHCRGFVTKAMPHTWGIVQIWFNESPPLTPYAPGGGMGLTVDRCISFSMATRRTIFL